MGEVATWIGLGLTALTMALGGMAYVQNQSRELRKELEAKMESLKSDLANDIAHERKLREEADARTERQVEGFGTVATAVVRMGAAVEHLTEKFGDHQRSQDRALDELKHSIRNVEQGLRSVRVSRAKAQRESKST